MSEPFNKDQEKAPNRKDWSTFANTDLVDFFNANKLKTLSIEDNDGNKAKLSIKMVDKEEVLKVEISSTQYH